MSAAAKQSPDPSEEPAITGRDSLPLIAIVGPTASGKSSLAVALARKLGGDVMACDSTQVYRGFDIGTSKPTIEERGGVPHHLLDLVEPASHSRRANTVRGRLRSGDFARTRAPPYSYRWDRAVSARPARRPCRRPGAVGGTARAP